MTTMHTKLWCLSGMLFCLNLMASERSSDQAFFNEMYAGSMLEIQAGTIAEQKAGNADVGKFAKKLAVEQAQAKQELDDLAWKKLWTVPVNAQDQHQTVLERLTAEKGAEFDSEYIRTMKENHREDAAKLKQAIPNIKDPDLKAWATKRLDAMNEHATEVGTLNK